MLDLENIVKDILGFKMSIMRPPNGRYNDSVLEIIHKEMNYSVILHNLDTFDWVNGANTNDSFQAYLDTIEYASKLNSSFISRHHDFVEGSATLARQAIDYVRGKGFNLVTISECLGLPSDNCGASRSLLQSTFVVMLYPLYSALFL